MAVQVKGEGEEVRADEVVAVACEREEDVDAVQREWRDRGKKREKERADRGEAIRHDSTQDIAAL